MKMPYDSLLRCSLCSSARTPLEENEESPVSNNMPPVPGFAILIADARSSQQAIDVTPLNGLPIAHAPRGLEADRNG
jgi:hypothetical protein